MRLKKLKRGFEKLTKAKARIIAHLIGDGALYKTNHDYVLKYEVRDDESLDQFASDVFKVYGLKPSYELNTSGFTGEIIEFVRLRSKLAYEDLLRYATYYSKDWKIFSLLLDSSKIIKKEFLKALFDDEGTVTKNQVVLYSINKKGLLQIMKILFEDFNIVSKLYPGYGERRNVYGLVINDIKVFKDKIGFSLVRKMQKLNTSIFRKVNKNQFIE